MEASHTPPVYLEEWTRKVGVLWFSRPAAKNALDIDALRAFAAIIDGLEDDTRFKGIMLAGKGKGLTKLIVNHGPDLALAETTRLAGEIFSIMTRPWEEREADVRALKKRLAGSLLDP